MVIFGSFERITKLAYEAWGVKHPSVSLAVFTAVFALLGALGGCTLWTMAAQLHEKGAIVQPSAVTSGEATTSGPNSPANTGNGNTFNYDSSEKKK